MERIFITNYDAVMVEVPQHSTGCEVVNKHISRQVPVKLWHYTSFASFVGIITSKSVWATEYRFLNDRLEFQHAKTLALELAEEEPEDLGAPFPLKDTLRKSINLAFNTGALREDRLRIMVASFSEEADLLSQWRGYANASSGVSIGFDLKGVRPEASARTAVTFAPCVYDDTSKRNLLKAVFDAFKLGMVTYFEHLLNAGIKKRAEAPIASTVVSTEELGRILSQEKRTFFDLCHTDLRFDLLRLAPLLKHSSFAEEKEWRLVLPNESGKELQNPVQYRATANSLRPYIAFSLADAHNDMRVPCTDVIVGPSSHAAAVSGVDMFLRSQGLLVLARRSTIPYMTD